MDSTRVTLPRALLHLRNSFQLFLLASALRLEQDDLSKLAEQFRREDEKVPPRRRTGLERRVTGPHTSSSRKTNEDDEEDQNMEIEEFDDEKELDDALARVLRNCGAGASEQEVDELVRSHRVGERQPLWTLRQYWRARGGDDDKRGENIRHGKGGEAPTKP